MADRLIDENGGACGGFQFSNDNGDGKWSNADQSRDGGEAELCKQLFEECSNCIQDCANGLTCACRNACWKSEWTQGDENQSDAKSEIWAVLQRWLLVQMC